MLESGIYDFVICCGGTDMCFVLGFGRKRPDLKQYRISGLTVFHTGMKCATLVSRSTMTQIESGLLLDLGSPVMKSMPICSHFHLVTRSGCNNPAGLWCSS